jgi:hypothetical protein
LNEALEDPAALVGFLAELGWEAPTSTAAIGIDSTHVEAVADALQDVLALWDGTPDDATILTTYAALAAALAVLAQDIYDLRTSIASHVDATFLNASNIAKELPKRLFDFLVMEYVRERLEPLHRALEVAGVFELQEVQPQPATFTSLHLRRTIRLDRLRLLVTNPAGLLTDTYGWGTPTADLNLLLARLYELGDSIGAPVALVYPGLELDTALSPPGTVVQEGEADRYQLELPLVQTQVGGASATFGLSLFPLPPETAAGAPGLTLSPFVSGSLQQEIALDRLALWLLKVTATLDLELGIALIARPGQPLRILFDPLGSATQASGALSAEVRRDAEPDEEIVILGTAEGSGIRARGIFGRAGFELRDGKPVLVAEFGAEQGRAGLSLEGSDSFIAKVLPAKIPDVNFDLGATFSSRDGLSFRGGAGLEVTVAADAALGPIRLDRIYLAVVIDKDGVVLGVAVAAAVQLGPFAATVDQVGIRFVVTLKKTGGNLGPIDARAQFKPPKGIGLVVDATIVKGGGYIFLDPDKGEYAGVLELSLKDQIALKAIGILSTRLPGGQPGFSLLLIITAQFQPIQLSFGFVLTGVGGLIGVNRTMLVDILRAGIRNRTIDSVMFPPNPVQNAPKIISDLKAIFPPIEGRFVVGPMLEIGWGTPVLVSARIGVFIELPAPLRLAILGQLKARLPTEDKALVKLNLDAIGIVEFEKKSLSIDATLYDSELVGFALSGDMALRLNWGEQPNFALSVGGLNPRFAPPPGFPALRRLALTMGSGNNPRLSLETYMALTSNTAQFGARLELRAEGGGFAVHGYLGFDALFVFSPFSFVTDMEAGVDLLRGTSVLMSIHLAFSLSGPRPWHAWGKASLKILFFTISVRFDVTWGDPQPVELDPVDAKKPLLDALADPRSWSAALPRQTELGVSLADATPTANTVLIHPMGRLSVIQKVVPLNLTITKFGNAAPATANHFAISKIALNAETRSHEYVQDFFAPGQFKEQSDAEALTAASYKLMDAGIGAGASGIKPGRESTVQVVYSTQIVDNPLLPSVKLGGIYEVGSVAYFAQIKQSAGERSPVRSSGEAKFSVPGLESAVRLDQPTFVIAGTDDLTVRDDLSADGGELEMAARERLEQYLAEHPEERPDLQVVPVHEAASA